MPRADETEAFLAAAGWAKAQRHDLGADFSPRRYARLMQKDGRQAILMEAEAGQKTELFVPLAGLLRAIELPAPQIMAQDAKSGLVLMEDFGANNLGAALDAGLDRGAADSESARLLARLHRRFDPARGSGIDLPVFDAGYFSQQAGLFLDFYFPRQKGRAASEGERADFTALWAQILAAPCAAPRTLVLRDYMPDNAMRLDTPLFGFSLGILDFQDAGLGPASYDLASWCEVIRRPGGQERLEAVIAAYAGGAPMVSLLSDAQLLLAQRYTRVLGILVRLERSGLIAGTARGLAALLRAHPALAPVRRWFEACGGLL